MMNWSNLRSMSPEEKKIRDYTRYSILAGVAFEDAKNHPANTNADLYVALSHLACAEELGIRLHKFEDLQFNCTEEFSKDAFILVRDKLKELEDLISNLVLEKGVG